MDESDLSRIIGDVGVVGGKFGLWDVLDEFPGDLGSQVREILRVVVLIIVPLDGVIDNWRSSSGFKIINFAPLNNCLIVINFYEDQWSHLLWNSVSEYLSQRRASTHPNTILSAYSIVKEFISTKMTVFIDGMFVS
jgi:hypothetical protein